jgi:hypothetical protein
MANHKETHKGYKLISAYIRLKQQEDHNAIEDIKFTTKLKGFHIFCSIIFLVFILDGFLPYRRTDTIIESYGALATKEVIKQQKTTGNEFVPEIIQIKTPYGKFITYDYCGFEKAGAKIALLRTPLFYIKKKIEFTKEGAMLTRWKDFHSTFIFWPILSLLLSLTCLLSRKFYGNPTLSVIVLLNIIPFFTVVYAT